ncbi:MULTISPECIES: DUF4244 domain-containing protein [unclassified Actinobaculum]|uniref:DUF4244 domain-containing protein n=1 Tax=unclassified Actinobaculum TaxID=2609299 RepID=UPI000D527A57|nr:MULTISPECIES: DUF4244 domain-containing protein [unclassified Actinobaculum]AWE41616.1 DUF4244 domain-containing protein [Actinobaculum sp. 313]MBE6484655.1 DUF4244 domain-containing protein [Actinomycetaceae bacterium]RTE49236.1 DUF4244 domain-containing protein [Actinobaculum sp. 352]
MSMQLGGFLEDTSGEAGMATAEYAIGTVAATSFAGLLVWMMKQSWVKEGLVSIFKAIFKF